MPCITLKEKTLEPVLLYLPEGSGPFPLICLTPLLGRLVFLEDLFFEKKIAAYFARQGFACAILERPIFEFDSNQGLEQLPRYLENSISRNRRTLDLLLNRSEIDAKQVGSFGMSFGAIVNCLWAAEDSRLKCHVLALGGADIPEIFITSEDPLMRSHREAALKKTNLDKPSLLAELKKIFLKDPGNAHDGANPDSFLMIQAVFDRVIRLKQGLKLRKALGNPRTLFVPLGHYTSILALPFLRFSAARFFKRKFSAYAPA